MPVDPVARAHSGSRCIDRAEWYTLGRTDDVADRKQGQRARKILRDSILASTDVFKAKPYFLSDEFSLVDASIAPILWRLPGWEIDLPPPAQVISKYANLVFSRPAFRHSLSRVEQEMRP